MKAERSSAIEIASAWAGSLDPSLVPGIWDEGERDMRQRRRALVALIAATALVAASCGDDDGDDDEVATTTAPETDDAGDAEEVDEPDDDDAEPDEPTDTDGPDDVDNGDDPEDASADDADAVCTEDRVGGSVTMGTFSEAAGLDPVVSRGTGVAGGIEVIALYDTLVRYDVENDEYVPHLAESLEPNDDFTEWTLTLRDGVTFGNGDPLTAESVLDSFARHQDGANQSTQFLQAIVVTDMEVVDDMTLVFTLDGPWARFPYMLANLAGMVTNQAVVDEQGEDFNTDPSGAGAGPYEVARYAPGEELVLRAKDDYWGGPVCIEELRFIFIPGASATYDAFSTGEIQVGFLRQPQVVARAQEDGVTGFDNVVSAGAMIMLNHETGPASDVRVRQALAAAVDPEVINQRAWDGEGIADTALIAEGSVWYQGLEGPQPDSERAADLVEQAKADGWDGSLELLCPNDPVTQEVCLATKAMADAAGMDVTIDPKPIQELIQQVLFDRNFEASGFGMSIPDAEPWIRLGSFLGSESFVNSGRYVNPEMDAALETLRSVGDDEERLAVLAEIQEIWNDTIPNIVYGASAEFVAIDDSIKGIKTSQDTQIYFDTAYIE